MPIYLYQHPISEEYIEVVQSMNEEHVYVDDKGVSWKRIFCVPAASIDGKISPSIDSFKKYTSSRQGTLGDLIDLSDELSQKRKDKEGYDPVKEKFYENYAKERNGQQHPDIVKREAKKYLERKGIEIEF